MLGSALALDSKQDHASSNAQWRESTMTPKKIKMHIDIAANADYPCHHGPALKPVALATMCPPIN